MLTAAHLLLAIRSCERPSPKTHSGFVMSENPASNRRLISKIVLVVALLAAVLFLYSQTSAQSAATSAFNELQEALNETESLEPVDVQAIVGKEPASTNANPELKETTEEYVWSSMLKSFVVKATYDKRATQLLKRVELETR